MSIQHEEINIDNMTAFEFVQMMIDMCIELEGTIKALPVETDAGTRFIIFDMFEADDLDIEVEVPELTSTKVLH